MERSLFGFIWRYSRPQQFAILAITVVSFPILYMTLELPKWIVNDAISGDLFPRNFFGISLDQIAYLIALCFLFLGFVVLNNIVKYVLNMYKGVVGERMLRRLRYMLYSAVIRFRLPRFRKVSSGEIIPMITAEVEDVGVFIGESIATPAFQGGTLLVYVVFIFAQDPWLGLAAVSLYPLQAYVIPKLQQKVIRLTRQRIQNIRTVSDRINETVGAIGDIQANDTSRLHIADLSDRLFLNYRIRVEIYRRKYIIKFLNNFLNQLPPFFFYSVGGALVIWGDLSFGALVAVLAAYKDLASPWKELLNYYQNLANVTVKYQTVVDALDVDDALPPDKLTGAADERYPLHGTAIELQNVTVAAAASTPEVIDVSLNAPKGARIAVFGGDGSGRSELLLAAAGLLEPVSGSATFGGQRMSDLSFTALASHRSFVDGEPYLFNDTIRANVVYALKTAPVGDPTADFLSMRQTEAALTGNSLLDIGTDWENVAQAGVDSREALDERVNALFEMAGLGQDLVRLGLNSHLAADTPDRDRMITQILQARSALAEHVEEDKRLASVVDLWDHEAFNHSATIGENVLFGLPADPSTPVWHAANDVAVRAALREADVDEMLFAIGADVAETMVQLFADTGADASLISDFSFIAAEDLPEYEERARRYRKGKGITEDDRAALIGLAFRIVPRRHRITTLSEEQTAKFVAARPCVHKALKGNENYALFEADSFISSLSIEENILFGKPRVDRKGASEIVSRALRDTLDELGLRELVSRAGLNFRVGVRGGRLSAGQRRRIGLVRALIKRPAVLILDTVVDGDAELLRRIEDGLENASLIVGTTDPAVAKRMDTTLVMGEGRLVASGDWDSVDPSGPQARQADPKEVA